MSADESPPPVRRTRQVERHDLPPGPARALRDAIYDLYLRADSPTLDQLTSRIAADDDLPGSPKRDIINRIISGRDVPAKQQDAVTVAVALARDSGRDPAAVAELVRDLWVAAKSASPARPTPSRGPGKPIGECDALMLEVHRAIDVPEHRGALPVLPRYVSRIHDERLGQVVADAIGGVSRIAVLVGGSSTGKTRACWEAIQGLPRTWRVWHPIDPSRPDAAVRAFGEIGPETVVWLNDAQHYLLTTNHEVGERVAAGLRTLLADTACGPALVLATLWPEYWSALTIRPSAGEPDRHAQARELLTGTDLRVPDTFSGADLRALRAAAHDDPRLRHADEHARSGRIAQHLAGVPELLRRYRNAPPAARAIIDIAIDARRLGHPLPIPHTLLAQAAPGYLGDHDWEQAGEAWLEQALAYTALPCNGVSGPLIRIRPRPDEAPAAALQTSYRLADYLEQTGRIERAGVFPPASFWNAAATTLSDPDVLREFGQQAFRRSRYHRAAQLYVRAADCGSTDALDDLGWLLECAGYPAGAEAAYQLAADRGDPRALWYVAKLREQAGDPTGAEAFAVQAAADRGDTIPLWNLAVSRQYAADPSAMVLHGNMAVPPKPTGSPTDAGTLYRQAAALYRQAADYGHTGALQALISLHGKADTVDADVLDRLAVEAAERGDTPALRTLSMMREQSGDPTGAEALAVQADDYGDTFALVELARLREQTGDTAGAQALYRRAAAGHGKIRALLGLAALLERTGDTAGAEALYRQAVDGGYTRVWRNLALLRERVGDRTGAEALAMQAIGEHGDTLPLVELARLRERTGDTASAEALYQWAADRGDTGMLRDLALLRERTGDTTGAEALYQRAIDRRDSRALHDLALLRERTGDTTGAEALAVTAAAQGHTSALLGVAELRERAGDLTSAEALYHRVADHGDASALDSLAALHKQVGDSDSANRIRRFGLTDSGSAATSLDFTLLADP